MKSKMVITGRKSNVSLHISVPLLLCSYYSSTERRFMVEFICSTWMQEYVTHLCSTYTQFYSRALRMQSIHTMEQCLICTQNCCTRQLRLTWCQILTVLGGRHPKREAGAESFSLGPSQWDRCFWSQYCTSCHPGIDKSHCESSSYTRLFLL